MSRGWGDIAAPHGQPLQKNFRVLKDSESAGVGDVFGDVGCQVGPYLEFREQGGEVLLLLAHIQDEHYGYGYPRLETS